MGDKNKTKMAAKLLSSTPIPRRDSVRRGKFGLHPLQVHLKLSDMSSLRATSSVFDMLVQSIQ
jgi:hypothetical protein